MAGTERDDLMDAYITAWNSHEPVAVADFFATGAIYDDRGAGELARGTREIRALVERVLVAFGDLRFEIVRAAHGDDFTAGEWRAEMTHTGNLFGLAATGRRLQTAGVDVATVEASGKISHLVSYYDGAQMMRALGLLPARGSRVERAGLKLFSLPRLRP